jgi:tetratricopeptide (TPR) repeat protein
MAGAIDAMRADSERLLELAREAKSAVTEVQAEMRLAQLAALTGGLPEEDVAHAEAAVKASTRVEDQKWHRRALMALGIARYYAGQRDIARKTISEIVRLAEAARDEEALSFACGNLGVLEMELGDFDAAERHLEEATRAEGIHARAHLYNLATVHHERGDYDRAERAYRDVIAGGARNPILSALAMAALGALLCERDEIAEGARLLDEAAIAIEKTGAAYTLVVETHRGHLDLALARRAAREGEEASSKAHRASAEKRLSHATADRSHMVDDMRTAIRWLERALDPTASHAADAWVIAEDGAWFRRPGGWRIDIGPRTHAKLVLAALVRARLDRPGQALSVDEVLHAGWPGERVLRRAAEARVYNIIKHLRSAGLRDLIVSLEGGYAIDPAQRVMSA